MEQFAIGYATPYMVDSGPGNADLGVKVFFIWGVTCICGGIFVFFCVPETKGLSLEEVDDMYATTSVLKSMHYKPRAQAQGQSENDLEKRQTSSVESDKHASATVHTELAR